MFFASFFRLKPLALALGLLGGPVWAQDLPQLDSLPVLAAPGTLAAADLPDQGFWLDVTRPGLYSLSLDGPGLIGLTDFETADGRSDGSDRQERLLADGSAYDRGVLADLFLLPGRSYLIQIAGVVPRGVRLDLVQPIDPGTALSRDATPGLDPAFPLLLDAADPAGQMFLLQPDAAVGLDVRAPPTSAVRLDVLTPPGADVRNAFAGMSFGPGGIFPIRNFDIARLELEGQPAPDGTLPLHLLRIQPIADADRFDESEPGDTDLGALPAEDRTIRGVLLAPDDRDGYLLTVTQAAVHDLSVLVPGGQRNTLSIRWNDVEILTAEMPDGQLFRAGLALQPGTYWIELSGSQDQPLPYTIDFAPAGPDENGEPDDRAALSRLLPEGQALRGLLGPHNPGHVHFDVPMPGHVWELRGVQGLADLELIDGNGMLVGRWEAASGALVLQLALPPGRYTAGLRGDGPYALRLSDKGPAPAGYETEPNDPETAATRLSIGQMVTGDLRTVRDSDFYEFWLAAPTPLAITATGPDDGPLVVDVFSADAGPLRAELPIGAPPASYSATYPAGRYLIQIRARDEGTSGLYTLQIERTNSPEPDEPTGVSAMPGDGLIAGRIGAFDALDRIFLPLPAGSGHVAIACQGGLGFYEIWTFGDEVRLLRGEAGQTAVLPYGPELGGALGVWIHAEPQAPGRTYDCRMRFAPGQAGTDAPSLPHDEMADEAQPSPVLPGQTITGSFETDRDRDRITLAVEPGQFAGLRCDVPADRLRISHRFGPILEGPALEGQVRPFLAGPDPLTLDIAPPAEGAFPQGWSCSLLPEEAFATPAMAGPVAEFTGFVDPAVDRAIAPAFDPATTLRLLSGGRPDWLSPRQVTQGLVVGVQVGGLADPFRAFDRLGQSANLDLQITNPGLTALTLRYDLTVLADGWRVSPATGTLTVEPGQTTALPVTLELPPMQSPVNDPQLMVNVSSGQQTASFMTPVLLDPLAPQRDPHRFWTASPALRGGMNPLLWQSGARLIALDGLTVDDATAEQFAFLHDGAALHTAIPAWFRARSTTFRLSEAAPVAGLMVHLRTTEDRARWPGLMSLELSQDGLVWAPAETFALTASDLPQVFGLSSAMQATFARISIPGCRTNPDCAEIALSDVGLIADPAWRQAAPVNLADPAFGGHVVWAQTTGGTDNLENPFGGAWNSNLITPGQPDYLLPRREDRGDAATAVIGFYAARAARISAVEWLGAADDIARLDGADIQVSITGPAGPWQDVGRLAAPPGGQLRARLDLQTPVWARAVRLTFSRHPTEDRALPDQIMLWEDPTAPPLLGLWEDDRPDAGYEATEAPAPVLAPAPAGGPDAAGAVPLPFGQTVTSSVQLERNSDWWRIDIADGPPRALTLRFASAAHPEFEVSLTGPDGGSIPLARTTDAAGDLILTAPVPAGSYRLAIVEPPRSVAILWDTSGSVQAFVPGILESVRLWSQSLQPGRDRLQLLPFGQTSLLLNDWADSPEAVYPALGVLPRNDSSDSETAMGLAAMALASQDGQRGIVVLTDAETSQEPNIWGPLLQAQPRVVALSIDSGDPRGLHIMQDWASLNGGYFTRVTGNAGLADGLDLAAALFRAPKGYVLTATLAELREPDGEGQFRISALPADGASPTVMPTGGIEVILDASGSMLQRLPDGQRRIEVAHDALENLVLETLPEGTPFAFRAFGLRVDACDSELMVPLGPLDRAAAAQVIRDVPAVNEARTAIAASLALAAQDLAAVAPPRVVVLVTDGEETCDGDVDAEIARLRDAGLDLRLTIVGFAIDDAALAATFAGWAAAGNGQYLAAGDSAGLADAISTAIAPRFAIDRLYVDGRIEQVGLTGLEQDMPLPAGQYRLRPLQTAQGGDFLFQVTDGALADLTYDPAIGIVAE